MALEPSRLSDFTIAGALGAGATAKVYEAVHVATGRPVAIKMLEATQQGSELRERFAREALLLSGVNSRHVSKIVGFGFERGVPFLVLEMLRGETLDAKLRREGRIPILSLSPWIEQLLFGLRDIHDAQIIHRDIKPSNIFLAREGPHEVVKLIDFGVARLRDLATDPNDGLTSTQHLIGSMGYMAPEQFRDAKRVEYTADLYAAGVVIFRALTGRLPFVSRSLEQILRMKFENAVPSISSFPDLASNVVLDWFVAKSMATQPGDRFQSAREMIDAWSRVAASFEEEDVTDVMRGRGGPASARPRPSVERLVARAELGSASPAAEEPTPITLRVPLQPTAPATPVSPVSPASRPARERRDARPDAFEVPTRTDPGLRELVERELELQRRRRRPT